MQIIPALPSPTKVTKEASAEIVEQKDPSYLENELLSGGPLPWRFTWTHNRLTSAGNSVTLSLFYVLILLLQHKSAYLTSIISKVIVRDFCVSTYDTTTEL